MNTTEIDQKQLKELRQRFIRLSEARFYRVESSFSPTQADYLKLLPMLFHVNHPMLPGFVDKFTPCGIPNYTPSKVEKDIVKIVSQSFEYKPRAHLKYPIASLFLMGSMGTLGQSVSSDIDLWLCLSEPLESPLLEKLDIKASRIKQWFALAGIELNYYLVSLDDFSREKVKKIDQDSCGNTQKYLLLDEFYRTAVWLAGRWPLWWLIPNDCDYQRYANRLITQKHIDSADWIDFGEVKNIPAAEYFSAALWQLYKAISSPYKSSVKLLVLEVYAKSFPSGGILSRDFKNKVQQGDANEDELDPYLLMLIFAENALLKYPQRLEFLRRAFYLKANVKIKINKKGKKNWRYKMIERLVKLWGWNQARLDYLNSRHQWGIVEVVQERSHLVRELTSSYHFLSSFARVHGVIDKLAKNELLSLSRNLYAAFERRRGKIDQLNSGIAKETDESAITLYQKSPQLWQFHLGHVKKTQLAISSSVYSASSLFECLSWGCVNTIITLSTQVHIDSPVSYLNHQFAAEMVRDLLKLINSFKKFNQDSVFEEKATPIYLGLFVNSRFDPLEEDKQENLFRVTARSDCFCWTDNKINLVDHFDILLINSWGEIDTQYYSGDAAWIEFFIQHEKILMKMNQPLTIFCRGLAQKDQVINRVRELFQVWHKLVQKRLRTSVNYRYLMAIGQFYWLICFSENNISHHRYRSKNKMIAALAGDIKENASDQSCQYIIDPELTIEPFLSAVLKRQLSDNIGFMIFQKTSSSVEVAVKSNNGSLHFQTHRNTNINQVLGHYRQFFEKVQNRNLLHNGLLESISYHEFTLSVKKVGRFKQIKDSKESLFQQFLLVQAIATDQHLSQSGFDLFTSNTSYLYSQKGESVYPSLRRDLHKMRKSKVNYPIFLTDLDVSAIQQDITLIDALNYKKQIELKLNRTKITTSS